MRNVFVLALIAVAGAAAWMQGCSSDDSSNNGNTTDAGKDGSSGASSGGGSGSTSGGSSSGGGSGGSSGGGSSSGGSSGATDAASDDSSSGGGDSATDDSSTSDAPSDDSSAGDAQTDDSSTPADGGDAGGGDASDSGGGDAAEGGNCVTLTVKDAPTGTPWCNVSVNGGAASTAGVQTVCVPAGTDVTLSATAQSSFKLGATPWHDTSGDHGSGDPGTLSDAGGMAESTTTVRVTPAKTCVWVCCPGASGLPECPTADQCP